MHALSQHPLFAPAPTVGGQARPDCWSAEAEFGTHGAEKLVTSDVAEQAVGNKKAEDWSSASLRPAPGLFATHHKPPHRQAGGQSHQ